MAAHRRVYDSHYLQADCQELGSVWATFTFLIPPTDVSSFGRFRHRVFARGGRLSGGNKRGQVSVVMSAGR